MYARPATYLCYKSNRKRYAAEGAAKALGHASIKTTMDRYVHVTNDSMSKAVLQFEKVQQNQNGTVMVQ